jgi:hypothetical protein
VFLLKFLHFEPLVVELLLNAGVVGGPRFVQFEIVLKLLGGLGKLIELVLDMLAIAPDFVAPGSQPFMAVEHLPHIDDGDFVGDRFGLVGNQSAAALCPRETDEAGKNHRDPRVRHIAVHLPKLLLSSENAVSFALQIYRTCRAHENARTNKTEKLGAEKWTGR